MVLVVRVLGNNIPVLRIHLLIVLLGYGYLLPGTTRVFMLALEVQVCQVVSGVGHCRMVLTGWQPSMHVIIKRPGMNV